MGGIISNIFFPIKAIYVKLFEINRFIATTLLASLTTFFLFVLMVTLTSLGETALKEDKSVKLADIVMPERDIETFTEEIEKPDEPEQKPEDIAQPEVDLQPVAGIEVSIAKPTIKFETSGTFFRDGSMFLYLRLLQYILGGLLKPEHKAWLPFHSQLLKLEA